METDAENPELTFETGPASPFVDPKVAAEEAMTAALDFNNEIPAKEIDQHSQSEPTNDGKTDLHLFEDMLILSNQKMQMFKDSNYRKKDELIILFQVFRNSLKGYESHVKRQAHLYAVDGSISGRAHGSDETSTATDAELREHEENGGGQKQLKDVSHVRNVREIGPSRRLQNAHSTHF